jgi:hypothetical protein
MPDLWFFLGLAFGIALMGFVTIGSFERGADSVRLQAWKQELVARKRASIASRSRHTVTTAFAPDRVNVPVATAVPERENNRPVPASQRRTRIRREHGEVLTHISL